jgi:uncharacterized protein (TIGR00645 family)
MTKRLIEFLLFSTRWLLVVFYLVLGVTLIAVAVSAIQHLSHLISYLMSMDESQLMLALLSLVDLTLAASLIVIVIFSGYANFVSRLDGDEHKNWPDWIAQIDFSSLKLKLISSIVAISAVQLLRLYMEIKLMSDRELI